MTKPLKICYLLETTELHGGVRIVFDQARALAARGHQVLVRACQGDHGWYPYPVDVQYVSDLRQPGDGFNPEVVVGTFWTTVPSAMDLGARLVVHFCQGCEWEMPEYEALKADIESVYARPIPKITIGPWLNTRIWERFGRDNFPLESVGQVVDTNLYHPPLIEKIKSRLFPGVPRRILVVGIHEAWVKGISIALEAVEMLRSDGFDLHLTRVSTLPLSTLEQERFHPDIYHHCLTPVQMAEVYQQADIFLAPSRSAEGFGLPFVEALATGLPAVATSIPSHLSMDNRTDYACFVPEGDSMAMADGLRQLLEDENRCLALSRRAVEVVQNQFQPDAVACRLEACFQRWLNGQENE
jgi:glycosyltransferase involved in cell wall biosynthesis